MKIYHYDETTGALVGEGVADADPMQPGKWLIPAHATNVEPPPDTEARRCFNAGVWEYRADDAPVEQPAEPIELPSATELRRLEIMTELTLIDEQSARPSRAVALAIASERKPDDFEINKLAVLEAKAVALREELKALQ